MKISVLMGTHNGARFISAAIRSIQAQTVTDWELIICDDGSTDNTPQILAHFAKHDRRIRILKNKQKSGLPFTLNRCLAQAQAPFIARMDDDDRCHPQRFATQLAALQQHPEISIVGCQAYLFSNQGIYGHRHVPEFPTAIDVFHGRNFIHPTVLMRRDMLISVGGYATSRWALRAEDFDLWCKAYAYGYRGMNLPQKLFYYREDQTNIKRRTAQQYRNVFRIMRTWAPALNLTWRETYYQGLPLLKACLTNPLVRAYYYRHYQANPQRS